MIIGDDLRAWASDPDRQRETSKAADHLSIRWNAGPVHQQFTAAMAALPPGDSGAVASAIRDLFGDDAWVETLLDALCEAARRDPYFEPPFRALNSDIHTGLVVFEDDNVSIAAGVSRVARLAAKKNGPRGGVSIGFTGQLGIFKFVKAGGALMSFWEVPEVTADFTAAGAGRCRRTGERRIEDGEILIVDGRFQSFVIEHAAANLVVLQASVKPGRAPLSVEYDAHSHRYVGCSAADDTASRIQMIATLLRKMDCEAAFPAVAAFVDHPDFFVRWHVMRELLGIDAVAALPHLRRMAAHDPHADTRRAARTVLDRVEGPAALSRKAA